MGEIDDGLWCEPLNFNNWTISFNEDVIEKDEQETALCNCVNGCTDFVKVGKKNKIQNIEMKTYYIVFNYIKPENGEIQGHVVWCENENNR